MLYAKPSGWVWRICIGNARPGERSESFSLTEEDKAFSFKARQ
jgi:hypothetical protein